LKLLLDLFDFQAEGVDFAVKAKYSINAYEMGLGKSPTAIAAAVKVGAKKILVVCPAFLIPNWINEIAKFTGERASGDLSSQDPFHVVSYTSIKRAVSNFSQYDFVICDEVHYAKNLDAKRTILLHELLSTHRPNYFIGLSGTPIKNKVPEFYSLLRLCWYGGRYREFDSFSTSFWKFCMNFTNRRSKIIGSKTFTDFEGLKNPEQLRQLIKPVYIRKRVEDAITLPDQIRIEHLIADKSKTDDLLRMAFESYEGKKASKSFASGKAISALGKVEYTVEFITENLEAAGKFIVFTDHVQSAKKLFDNLDHIGCRYITGQTPVDLRESYVESLNKGEIKILIATIGSLSVGVNLTGCNRMIFNDLPWVPADIEQAEKRIHRIGQKSKCFYYYILASKYDEYILRTLNKKRKLIEQVEKCGK
jgi:SWI/SNF-related matrix-associated actin-dependent regulator 1 of chromatin subfamily A